MALTATARAPGSSACVQVNAVSWDRAGVGGGHGGNRHHRDGGGGGQTGDEAADASYVLP